MVSAASARSSRLLPAFPFALGTLVGAACFVGRDDLGDLLAIERLYLVVVNRNRNQRTTGPIKDMVRTANPHQPIPGPLQLFSDFREPNRTRHGKYTLCYTRSASKIPRCLPVFHLP